MKKCKLLLIPAIFVSVALGMLFSNTNGVNAANNKVCTAETFRDKYLKKINMEQNGNNIVFENKSGLNLSYKFIADGNTSNASTGNINNNSNVSFTASSGGLVYFYLVEDFDNGCKASAGTEIGKIEFNVEALIDNPLYYDSICVNYRNRWSNDEAMKNAVPYCYSPKTYSIYSREQVQEWINTAESLRNESGSGGSDITIDNSYKEVKDVTKTDKLVCDAFSTNNYETMHKYYHVDTKNDGNGCEVTCKEEIEVNFSDPVATQAGLCFQYLIEIKSKVVCDSNYTKSPPTRKQVCYPTPVCISGSSSFDAGGPNEEFDECIKSCDGGKYTQSCINSCYEEVYVNKSKVKKTTTKYTKDEVKAISPLYVPDSTFYQAIKTAGTCSWNTPEELFNLRQKYPGGYYNNGNWIQSGTCPSQLGPYYFRNLQQTKKTIDMLNGYYSYSGGKLGYYPDGNGILRENYGSTYCDDACYWSGSCGSDTVLTEKQAQEQYEKDVEAYLAAKTQCEQKTATCTNETTDYKIIVNNEDNDNDSKDDEEIFSSSQKLNSNKVNGNFPTMVTLVDGSCEDGKDDPWHYHNIITFPGAWINNKTGKVVHSMDPSHEDFYTYIGNQYCTKLNSVPVNTAWYNWKVNQNGDVSVLTDNDKKEIEKNLEMNINGHIDNYGYFGWNFDVSCFYALDEIDPYDCDPNDPECCDPSDPDYSNCSRKKCPPTDPNCDKKKVVSPINDYEFRPIALDNMFPSDKSKARDIGFNWTCAATNLENPDYLIQPVSVMNRIQALGDSIYKDNRYLDYHIKLTPETMRKVRNYNDKYDNYSAPTSDDSNVVLTAGANKTSGITVYKSYLLHKVLNSSELLKSGLIGCNNEDNGSCLKGSAAIDTSTSCYNEYMASSAVLKGVK